MNGYQVKFLEDHFFKNEKFAGWANIANELIRNGTVIVAGDGCIWHGGIGNFIKKSPAENAVGCTRLTFQKDEFLKSEWYKPILEEYLKQLFDKKAELTREIEALVNW